MDVKEAATLLGCKRETVLLAIREGVKLPSSSTKVKLLAEPLGSSYELTDADLQTFIDGFEAAEPGRHPPVSVRRQLRTEANHRCGICRSDLPLQFHHMLAWSELKHHDPNHMIAICGGCHDKITHGQIDLTEQRIYKRRLLDALDIPSSEPSLFPRGPASPLSWDSLRDVVKLLHATVVGPAPTADSRFDFSLLELNKKNTLNRLGEDSFAVMREMDEPYFSRIQDFLSNPYNREINRTYHEVVDEIRRIVAVRQSEFDRFEDLLEQLYHTVRERFQAELSGKTRTLRILISFMYFTCDIGRK